MIGIILTGHGEFAYGMNSSMELIAGKPSDFKYVSFNNEMSQEELEINIRKAIEEFSYCDYILILTDITGGTPFNVSFTISMDLEKIKVITGVNLPLLLTLILTKDSDTEFDSYIESAIEEAKGSINFFCKDTMMVDSSK